MAFSTGLFCVTKCHRRSSKLRLTLYQTAEDSILLPLEKKVELHVKKGSVAWGGYISRGGEARAS